MSAVCLGDALGFYFRDKSQSSCKLCPMLDLAMKVAILNEVKKGGLLQTDNAVVMIFV